MRDTSHDQILIEPIAIADIVASNGTGVGNLRSPDPKEVWAAGAANASLTVDLGAIRSIDTVLLGYTSASPSATWSITGGASGPTDAALASSRPLAAAARFGERRHGFVRLGAPALVRYLRVSITDAAAILAGVLVVGLAWRPEWPRELGPAAQPFDTGSAERQASGGFSISDGVTKALYKWAYGDLTRDELGQLNAMVRRLGRRRPLVVVEDPADEVALGEGIHYGLLDQIEPPERLTDGRARWALGMEEWV